MLLQFLNGLIVHGQTLSRATKVHTCCWLNASAASESRDFSGRWSWRRQRLCQQAPQLAREPSDRIVPVVQIFNFKNAIAPYPF